MINTRKVARCCSVLSTVRRTAISSSSISPTRCAATPMKSEYKVLSSKQFRHFSTISKSETPPLLIRTALVGTSVGLASPLFAVAGIGHMWFSYLPRSTLGTLAKYTIGVVAGGGLLKVIYEYVGPFFWSNSDVVLPFAVSNAVASSFWYLAIELGFGMALLRRTIPLPWVSSIIKGLGNYEIPLVGPVIGGLTAITAPFLWPAAFRTVWGKDFQHLVLGEDATWITNMYEWIAFPVGVPVGIFSGFMMHVALQPAILGVPGKPWTKHSLPILGVLSALSVFYFGFCRCPDNEFYWQKRQDPFTGKSISYNIHSKEILKDNGKKADNVEYKRNLISVGTALLRDPWLKEKEPDYNVTEDQPILDDKKSLSIDDIADFKTMYSITDHILRLKQLDLTQSNTVSKYLKDPKYKAQYEALSSKLQLKINQLPEIVQDLELLILIERNEIISDADKEVIVNSIRNKYTTREFLFDPKSIAEAKNIAKSNWNLFIKNIKLLDKDFQEVLKYNIESNGEVVSRYRALLERPSSVNDKQRANDLQQSFFYWVIVPSAVAAATYFFVGGNR